MCLRSRSSCFFRFILHRQSGRRPHVSATERAPRRPPPLPPALASSLSSVPGRLSVHTSLSATNTEPTSLHSATPASASAGAWTPAAKRYPTLAPDRATPLCVSHVTAHLFSCRSVPLSRALTINSALLHRYQPGGDSDASGSYAAT